MDEEYISIADAATMAGYKDDTTLHMAARDGKLKTKRFGTRARVTTRAWLEDYLSVVKQRGMPRGQPRTGAAGAAEE